VEQKPIVITRDELYNKVWSTPMIILAKDYGISDVALRKICKKLLVPVPKIGYWQKKRSGAKVDQAPLPTLPKDHRFTSHTIFKHTHRETPKDNHQDSEIGTLIEHEKSQEHVIRVPGSLISPHPFVRKTEQSLKNAKPDIKGLVRPRAKKCLDLYVSPQNVSRSLLIMDTLLKAYESRGYKVAVSDDENKTSVIIMDEDIQFSISESYTRHVKELTPQQEKEKEKKPWMYYFPEYFYKTSGRLSLQILESCLYGTRKTWGDGKRKRIEDCLNSFIIGLNNAALAKKNWRLENEKREREWEEERQRGIEESIRQMKDEQKIQHLDEQLDLFRKSKEIREFLDLWKQACINCIGEIPQGSKIEKWINWIQEYADRIDPLNEDHLTYYDVKDD